MIGGRYQRYFYPFFVLVVYDNAAAAADEMLVSKLVQRALQQQQL